MAVANKSCIQSSEGGPKLSIGDKNSNLIEFIIGKNGNTNKTWKSV